MTPERIKELRARAERFEHVRSDAVLELVGEVERLQVLIETERLAVLEAACQAVAKRNEEVRQALLVAGRPPGTAEQLWRDRLANELGLDLESRR